MPLELSMKFLQSSDSIQAFKQDSAVSPLLTLMRTAQSYKHRVFSIFLQVFVMLVVEVVVVEVVVVVVVVVLVIVVVVVLVVVVTILKENKLISNS